MRQRMHTRQPFTVIFSTKGTMNMQDERQTRRRYSDEDVAMTLALLKSNDGNVMATATQTGIPEGTIRYWAESREPSIGANRIRELRAKNGLADAFDEVAWLCVGAITREKLEKANLKDVVISSAIATEKRQLLRGEPTTITLQTEAKATIAKIMEATGISEQRAREIVADQLGISVDELVTSDEVM